MIDNAEAVFFGDSVLQRLDFLAVELNHRAAFHAHDMVVVAAFVQFIYRLARFEMVAQQDTRLLKLRQHAVNGGNADFNALIQQNAVHIFGAQMFFCVCFKQIQNFQARAGHLQTVVF